MKHPVIFAAFYVTVILAKDHAKHSPIDKEHYSGGEHNDGYDHEAVLGSKDAEKEYSKMDPDEAQKRLAGLVKKMDKNQDERVDKDELIHWIKRSFEALTAEEAKQEFSKQDKNQDKQLSWEEFLDFEHSQTLEKFEKIKMEADPEMKEFIRIADDDQRRFRAADQNEDGKLDFKEYEAFYHPTQHGHMFEYELKKKLDALDKNKDGKISLQEYLSDLDETTKKEEGMVKTETDNFSEFDANKDGVLDKAEMNTWLMDDPSHGDDLAKDEAEHLIRETDTNDDGVLSKDEIVEKYNLWVGTHAMNHGKRLEDEL